jgi:hypothetical protein
MGDMTVRNKNRIKRLSEEDIDKMVMAQADDDSAWEKPIQVRTQKATSVLIPGDLATRAAFLAKLHKEKSFEEWLMRVIRERIEIEEVAFAEAKREMSWKNRT